MLDRLTEIFKLTTALAQVSRTYMAPGFERNENDAEHSYQLALVAWFLIEKDALALDPLKVIGMALIHDLVEVHAGDTYFYSTEDAHAAKTIREAEAAKQLAVDFPDFPSLHTLIAEYETRKSAESRFVYALDKLLPVLGGYLGEGRNWKTQHITLEMLTAKKTDRIALSPEIVPYYEELVKILTQEEATLFPSAP